MRRKTADRNEAMAGDLAAMRRYARALTRDPQDADDIVQDALVRAIERRESFKPERDRRRWLLAIVHNVFVSGRRRLAAEARRDARFAETLMTHLDPQQEQHARLTRIAHAFSALSDPHRAVLHLIVIEGMSYQDAADVLGVPIGTVMSRLARARASLRSEEAGPHVQKRHLRVVGGEEDD